MSSKKTAKIYDRNIGIERLLSLVSVLRDPKTGCPWDISQNHNSIAQYCIEEAYELEDAISQGDVDSIKKELGDLLFQIIFHCNLAEKNNTFSFNDVIQTVCDKMIFRHPHVFGNEEDRQSDLSSKEIAKNWENLKKLERDKDAVTEEGNLFVNVPNNLPALTKAVKVQKRASEVEYDFPTADYALDKIREEINELQQAVNTGKPSHIEEEIGDVLFSIVNFSRKMDLEPEKALRLSIEKFIGRINSALLKIKKEKVTKTELNSEKLNEVWNLVKREQGRKNE